ncbi:hypothetical protein L7F22_018643 [Adiantum nelumboides]|nr:hypothetical protein [Adiantum nelumboides]
MNPRYLISGVRSHGCAVRAPGSAARQGGFPGAGADVLHGQEDEAPSLHSINTAEAWFSFLRKKENTICPQQALLFQALHQRWRAAQDRHAFCKQALNRNLFLRLLAFISDLVAYRDSKDAQHRMEFLLPTATALFDSPLYFPHQPHDGRILNQFVLPNGLTVLQTLAAQFKRAPRLEGVCTAHTLAPLLKRLFAIGDDAFHSKEFKDFHKEFTRVANAKLRSLCNTSHIQSQLHGHHNQEAATNKKQQQQKENRKKKKSNKSKG